MLVPKQTLYIIYRGNEIYREEWGEGVGVHACVHVSAQKGVKRRNLQLFPYSEVLPRLAAVELPSTSAMFGSSKQLAFLPALPTPSDTLGFFVCFWLRTQPS